MKSMNKKRTRSRKAINSISFNTAHVRLQRTNTTLRFARKSNKGKRQKASDRKACRKQITQTNQTTLTSRLSSLVFSGSIVLLVCLVLHRCLCLSPPRVQPLSKTRTQPRIALLLLPVLFAQPHPSENALERQR